ncbi:MAG: hypothetical protein CL608_00910 [Anaerolineaceae bacterium]|nr:hypothetical protein [Anaerolineaceae bacterium]
MTDFAAAQKTIDDFTARFGSEARAYLDLAQHAALPLALTPDLLYLIWFDFRTDEQGKPLKIPWVAVADLLLSHLCQEISSETYALDDGVRHLLLQQMVQDGRFGMARVQRLAAFLDQYAERQLHSDNPYTQEAGQAQRLTAYAYANPQQLVAYLSQLYEKRLPQSQMIRYATLLETLQVPVIEWDHADAATQQTFRQAQAAGRSLAEWARGDVDTAVAQLREQFGRGVIIGDTAVALPDDVQQALSGEPAGEAAATDLPAFFNDFVDRIMFDVSSRLEAALRAVGAWQQDPGREQLMLITGQRGSSKTNLAVNFVKQVRQQSTEFGILPQTVGAYHFCMADRPETLDARLFVRSVQQQLSERYPRFRDTKAQNTADDPNLPWDLWLEKQLIDPLRPMVGGSAAVQSMTESIGPSQEDLLIVVDDVDAATQHKTPERILDVCLRLVAELPGLRLLLTTEMSTAVRDTLESLSYASFTLDIVYRNFDLRIQEAPTKQPAREVEVLASPAGVSTSPFVITHDDDLVRRINGEMSKVTPETPRQPIGADLFRTFIAEETRELLRSSMAQVQQAGERLRLRLFLPDEAYVSLPWEWLYEEGAGFWVQQPDVSLVRYRQQTAVFRTRANPQPIHVLVASAMPTTERPFPAEEMVAQLEQYPIAESGRIALTTMQNTSLGRLRDTLVRESVHVLHLAVAIEYDGKQPLLVMENETGLAKRMATKDLIKLAQESELALLVLTAVHEDQWTAVLQTADELVAGGIPAVVALPALLPAQLMAQGVATLLDQLADGAWLDTAAAAARQAMSALREGEVAGVDLVLFTSTPHGNIWRSEVTAVDLYEALADGFTLADLRDLCFELRVDFENLTGEGRRGQMVSLVRQMQQQDQLQALAMAMLDARPNTNFAYRQQATVDETAVPAELLDRQTLLRVMNDQFNLEEIRVLCFALEVNYDELRGETKKSKVIDLIELLERRQALPRLVTAVLRQRPNLGGQFQTSQEEPAADPVEIFRILVDQFSFDDLRDLIFEMGVNEEDLGGTSHQAKAREFVLWIQRNGRLPELVQAIQRTRGILAPSEEQSQSNIDIDVGEDTVTFGDVDLPIQEDYGTSPAPPSRKDVRQEGTAQAINQALLDYFNHDELKTVSFEMRIDYDNLAGEGKEEKVRALVEQVQQQNRLSELTQHIQNERPNADLGGFGEAK